MTRRGGAVATAILVIGAALAPFALHAHALSVDECSEDREFIRNATLARDNGMAERQFIAQFVHDKDDEVFRLLAVQDVFPRPAAVNRAQFAMVCAPDQGRAGQRRADLTRFQAARRRAAPA